MREPDSSVKGHCGLLLYFSGGVGSGWGQGGGVLLSSASTVLQPGHKLLGRLVLQVGADVAGVGAVCVAPG